MVKGKTLRFESAPDDGFRRHPRPFAALFFCRSLLPIFEQCSSAFAGRCAVRRTRTLVQPRFLIATLRRQQTEANLRPGSGRQTPLVRDRSVETVAPNSNTPEGAPKSEIAI